MSESAKKTPAPDDGLSPYERLMVEAANRQAAAAEETARLLTSQHRMQENLEAPIGEALRKVEEQRDLHGKSQTAGIFAMVERTQSWDDRSSKVRFIIELLKLGPYDRRLRSKHADPESPEAWESLDGRLKVNGILLPTLDTKDFDAEYDQECLAPFVQESLEAAKRVGDLAMVHEINRRKHTPLGFNGEGGPYGLPHARYLHLVRPVIVAVVGKMLDELVAARELTLVVPPSGKTMSFQGRDVPISQPSELLRLAQAAE